MLSTANDDKLLVGVVTRSSPDVPTSTGVRGLEFDTVSKCSPCRQTTIGFSVPRFFPVKPRPAKKVRFADHARHARDGGVPYDNCCRT